MNNLFGSIVVDDKLRNIRIQNGIRQKLLC